MRLKQFIKKQFGYLLFFYSYLKWRVILSFLLSFLTGILDGLGLALIIPLLQIVFNDTANAEIPGSDFLNKIFFDWLDLEPVILDVFLIIFLLFSLKGAIKFMDAYLSVLWQQKMMREIRFNSLHLFSNYKYPSFVNLDTGRVQNTLGSDVAKISVAYKFYFKTVNFFVLVLAYFSLSLGVDWKFTLLVLLGGIIISLLYKILYKRTKYFSNKLVGETNYYHKLLIENINLFKYLKATGLIDSFVHKLKGSILKMEQTQRRLGIVDAILMGIREPLIILVIFGAILFYTELFNQGITGVLLSLLFIYRAFSFFMASQQQWNLFLGYSGSLENLKSFNKLLQQSQEKDKYKNIFRDFKQSLTLKNVSFSYNDKQNPILNKISFSIKKNTSVAIVGPSGSGKTTLMNILTGLLIPNKGDFFVDDVNFKEIDQKSFRRKIGYIVQDATIFNDTLFNNVTFWEEKSKTNLTRFKSAVKKANIEDFIYNLPEKEETLIGTNGVNISGGQKQRISIARELYKKVEILLMDEATSSLDTETEFEIQKNISNLKGNYTFITIAHRLATIREADKIILLEDGAIKAIGDYEHLLKISNAFRKMVEMQEL
ncbi:ABC-type multidrug transport system, ATPase and permease component [Salegentibacter holothuriorum]|uniref:ABC-type multidrug transport system, ATPase and permease component n=1 Tax=Salegentibacter holothuriorum TaxID=241145 RepID=A0A1T5APC6_9FLAO|nr:ABC transporter ATP-binding protein [Salegentibacter holothuriorum]SKB36735.1 ABC-type multidrug transport system, ATPase and permease component [Salegentibacter holothuriorum]